MPADTMHPVAAGLDELLRGARRMGPFVPAETRSASRFERVELDGEQLVLKLVHLDDDFTMRVSGDLAPRTVRAWAHGLLDAAGDVVDHAIRGVATGVGRNGWGAAFLMRDVTRDLLPVGDAPFSEPQHAAFIDGLAAIAAATWGFADRVELLAYPARWRWFDVAAIQGERALGWPEPVPRIAAHGWERFARRAPRDVAQAIDALRHDVTPLVSALRTTPSSFLHGDWKASNLGIGADGRVVAVDWAYVGEGPVCHEIAWYVSLNRSRLPPGHTKESSIGDLRRALQRRGIDTRPWWETQLPLCLLGAVAQFGWEKALGDDDELGWWTDRAREGLARL